MPVIRSSPSSPFGRKVKIAAALCALTSKVTIEPADTGNPNDSLRDQNPLGKIPVLITDDGTAIYDSRVIAEWLDVQAGGGVIIPRGEARFAALTLQALADGIMDASILIVYEGRFRPEEKHHRPWMDLLGDKVARALSVLEAAPPEIGDRPHIGHVALACALGYRDFRFDGGWRSGHPGLVAWLNEFAARVPAFAATALAEPAPACIGGPDPAHRIRKSPGRCPGFMTGPFADQSAFGFAKSALEFQADTGANGMGLQINIAGAAVEGKGLTLVIGVAIFHSRRDIVPEQRFGAGAQCPAPKGVAVVAGGIAEFHAARRDAACAVKQELIERDTGPDAQRGRPVLIDIDAARTAIGTGSQGIGLDAEDELVPLVVGADIGTTVEALDIGAVAGIALRFAPRIAKQGTDI
jgi:glutathione S-transferase